MIFTYMIEYDGIDEYGCIEFCAKSKQEAKNLFREWCLIDKKMKVPIEPYSVKVIYDEYDAMEYGDNYANN